MKKGSAFLSGAESYYVKTKQILTAFQQDKNPLIQLNQDNIENTVKQRIMPPTLPTKKATIQQENIPNCKQTNFQYPDRAKIIKTHRVEE